MSDYKTRNFFFFILLLTVACGQAQPPTLTSTGTPASSATPTLIATRIRPTPLPPTWTPTIPPTDAPTSTPRPTRPPAATLTPINLEALCEAFIFEHHGVDEQVYHPGDIIVTQYEISPEYRQVFIGFLMTHRESDEAINVVVPGGKGYDQQLQPELFAASGIYDWVAGILIGEGDEVFCEQSGTFVIDKGSEVIDDTPVPSATSRTIFVSSPVPSVTPLESETIAEAETTPAVERTAEEIP